MGNLISFVLFFSVYSDRAEVTSSSNCLLRTCSTFKDCQQVALGLVCIETPYSVQMDELGGEATTYFIKMAPLVVGAHWTEGFQWSHLITQSYIKGQPFRLKTGS